MFRSFFERLYASIIRLAKHRHSDKFLSVLCLLEACILPVPPDAMLVPMTIADKDRGYYFASLAAISSAVGGTIGYCMGSYLVSYIVNYALAFLNLVDKYEVMLGICQNWGALAVFITGFIPFAPYKLFTISSGVIGLSFPLFLLAAFLSRSARFFLVVSFLKWRRVGWS